MSEIDSFLDDTPPSAGAGSDIDAFLGPEEKKSSTARRVLGDGGISLLKGAIAVPETAVGLADIATGGAVGKAAERLGFRPKEAKQILDSYLTPEQQQANKAVQQADGFVDTLGAVVDNPSTIPHAVAESLPPMLGGGAVGRGIGALAPKVAPWAAGAIGEGVVGAGMAAEGMRQQTKDGLLTPEQQGAAIGSGLGTAALGAAGGRLAQKLGITDVDTALASGTAQQTSKGLASRVAGGAVVEGALQEMPQSMQEQAWQNYGMGKPLDDGVGAAGAMGLVTGGLIGAGAGALSGPAAQPEQGLVQPEPSPENPAPVPVPRPNPNNGPMSRAASMLLPPPAPVLDTDRIGQATGLSAPPLLDAARIAQQLDMNAPMPTDWNAPAPAVDPQRVGRDLYAKTGGPVDWQGAPPVLDAGQIEQRLGAQPEPAQARAAMPESQQQGLQPALKPKSRSEQRILSTTFKKKGAADIARKNLAAPDNYTVRQQGGAWMLVPKATASKMEGEDKLRSQLAYIENQARTSGGWTPPLSKERARLRQELEPFDRAADLERIGKQLADLEKDLAINPVPPPAWLRQGAPIDSEVFRKGKPYVVTGHRYGKDGWFVIAEDDKGATLIPYMEATDSMGMPLYDEHEFVAPAVMEQKPKEESAEARYSRAGLSPSSVVVGTVPENPISLAEAEAAVQEFFADYNGNIPLTPRIRKTQHELYGPNGSIERIGVVKGAYHPGRGIFTLASDHLHSRADARETLRHEILGHYGLDTFKPADKQVFLEKILASKGEPSLLPVWKFVSRVYSDKPDLIQAEEVFARIAEEEHHKALKIVDLLRSVLTRLLRNVGLKKRGILTRSELLREVEVISKGIRNGNRTLHGGEETEARNRRSDDAEEILPAAEVERAIAASPELTGVKVVQSFDDLPIVARLQALRDGVRPEQLRGVYSGGSTYVVADNHGSVADAVYTAVHEEVGHRGIRGLLGSELDASMQRLYASQARTEKGRQRIAQIRRAYASVLKRLSIREKRLMIAEEMVAHLLEDGDQPTALQRVLSKMRELLRRMFPQVPWTYTDILALGEQSRIWLRRQQEGTDQNETRYSLSGLSQEWLGSRVPFKLERRDVARSLRGKLADLKPSLLGALPLTYLRDFAPKSMTALERYQDEKRAMDADRNELHSRYDAIAQRWLKLRWTNRKAERALSDLMHAATLAGIDPSKVFRGSPDQQLEYDRLRAQYEALPEGHRAMFGDARDAYRMQVQTLEQVIEDNIRKSAEYAKKRARRDRDTDIEQARDELTGAELDEAIEAAEQRYARRVIAADSGNSAKLLLLRKKFESMRVDEPYFPLKRYGDYFVALRDGQQLVSFGMYESAADMEAAAADLRRTYPGLEVKIGRKSAKQELAGAVDPAFVSDLQELVARLPNSQEVGDQIWQMYLDTLPDYSMRKGFIHRKKVAGFDRDALRAFASSMFHSSYQIARLKHSLEMNELVEQVEEQAKEAADPVDAMTIANELRQRHEWVMAPKGGKIAQRITSAAFVYQLGITPAAALVNTSQTWMMGIPVLGTRFGGEAKAMAALAKASKDFVKGRGHIEKQLSGDEAGAFAEFTRMGLIDKTQAHDLAGVGETGVEYNPVRHKVMGYIGWAFHNAERYNREVTAMAAYRMGRASGLGHEAAIKEAADLTWTTHFDYSSGNRARYLQNDTAKVLFVFRQHSINMLSRLVIDLKDAMKGETQQVKTAAKRRLAGMFAMFTLFAGVMGVPGMQALLALLDLLDDDDDPWSAEDKIKRTLAETLGPDVSKVLLGGVPGAALDLSLTDRLGMGSLWFWSSNRELEGQDAYYYWMEQMLGAAPAMVGNAFTGMAQIGEGNVWRGIETMMPKAIKDAMRSGRYAQEGVQTMAGDALVSDVSTWNVISQAMGFTPAHIAEQYDTNSALKNAEQKILTERRSLLNRFAMATRTGDQESRQAMMARIGDFNQRYPQVAITGKTILLSMKARAQRDQITQGGVALDKRLEFLRNEM